MSRRIPRRLEVQTRMQVATSGVHWPVLRARSAMNPRGTSRRENMAEQLRTGVVLQFAGRREAHELRLGDLHRTDGGAQLCHGADARVLPLAAGDTGDRVVVNTGVLGDVAPGSGSFSRLERGDDLIEAHKPILGLRALTVKASAPKACGHHSHVPEQDQEFSAFRENLKSLIGDGSVNAWAKAHNLEQTTVNRIVTGEADPKLSMVEKVARALRVEPWKLLVPGFRLEDQPVLKGSARDTAEELAERMERVISELQELKTQQASSPAISHEEQPRRRKAQR